MQGSTSKIVEVERFRARSDDGAEDTTIVITQKVFQVGNDAPVPGLKSARTIDGDACNFKGEGLFENIQTGNLLRRVNDA